MSRPLGTAALAAATLLLASGCAEDREGLQVPAPYPIEAVDCGAGTGELFGGFKAPNGVTGIARADVTLDIPECAGLVAKTDQRGFFKFIGLPAGTVSVTAARGNFEVTQPATVSGGPAFLVIPKDSVSLAYVPGDYDSIETVLGNLGFEPTEVTTLAGTDLSQFQMLFLNCTTFPEVGVGPDLAAYVTNGGTLYASDWAYEYVEQAFPSAIDFLPDPKIGSSTQFPVTATVLDPDLAFALGSDLAQIQFDLDIWVLIDAAGAGTTPLIEGIAPLMGGGVTPTAVPLAVQFAAGAGRVIYTSFHNEDGATEDMHRILENFIFSL
jgi:hypothetical protein